MSSGLRFSRGDGGRRIVLPTLHLPLERQDDLTVLVSTRGLHVHDTPVRLLRRATDAEHERLGLDRVSDVHRNAETHVDVLEIGATVLRDVLDALAEDDVHHQSRRCDQAPIPVCPGEPCVLRQGVGREREVREDREQALGQRLAPAVPEYLAGTKLLDEISVLPANGRHGQRA
jgi:hypothetical protein